MTRQTMKNHVAGKTHERAVLSILLGVLIAILLVLSSNPGKTNC